MSPLSGVRHQHRMLGQSAFLEARHPAHAHAHVDVRTRAKDMMTCRLALPGCGSPGGEAVGGPGWVRRAVAWLRRSRNRDDRCHPWPGLGYAQPPGAGRGG